MPPCAVKSGVTFATLAFWAYYGPEWAQLSRVVHENESLISAPRATPLILMTPMAFWATWAASGPPSCPPWSPVAPPAPPHGILKIAGFLGGVLGDPGGCLGGPGVPPSAARCG